MKEKTGEMMTAGPQPKHLPVQYMGQPGQRMPVVGMCVGEGPDDGIKCNAILNMEVFVHVFIVIIIDKIKPLHLPVSSSRDKYEQQGNEKERNLMALKISCFISQDCYSL